MKRATGNDILLAPIQTMLAFELGRHTVIIGKNYLENSHGAKV